MEHASTPPGRLLGVQISGSDSVGLGRSLRICISNKYPDDADAAGLGARL